MVTLGSVAVTAIQGEVSEVMLSELLVPRSLEAMRSGLGGAMGAFVSMTMVVSGLSEMFPEESICLAEYW